MRIESLTCNSCGAPLQVPPTANYVTCNQCSSQLVIRRSEHTTFTEQLHQLTEQTQQLSSRVDNLSSQNDLSALDRQWELERENYMVSSENGQRHIPTQSASLLGGVLIAVFGCVWTAMAIGITSSGPSGGVFGAARIGFPVFGVVFVIIGVVSCLASFAKAGRYQQAEREYRQRRQELERKTKR